MTVDVSKLKFYSGYPIDKITTDNTNAPISYSIAGNAGVSPTTSLQSITNPFGAKGLSTCSFSVDNINFYDQNSPLIFYSVFHAEPLTQMQVQCGVSDSTIYFFIQSNYHDAGGTPITQTVYINYAVDFPT